MKAKIFLTVSVMSLFSIACKNTMDVKPASASANLASGSRSLAAAATADLLWSGTASSGTGVFNGLDLQSNDSTYASTNPSPSGSYVKPSTDGAEGTVWHFHKAAGDRRAEARGAAGLTVTVGQTYYIGYKFKLAKVPAYNEAGGYHAIMQWKTYGTPNTQNYPLLFTYNNGNAVLQHFPAGGSGINLYSHAVSAGIWYSVVFRITVGNTTSTGLVQMFWGDDSAPETLLTGGTSYTCKTFDGTSIQPKWGYYHETDADGDDYFSRLAIGTTYASVQPY